MKSLSLMLSILEMLDRLLRDKLFLISSPELFTGDPDDRHVVAVKWRLPLGAHLLISADDYLHRSSGHYLNYFLWYQLEVNSFTVILLVSATRQHVSCRDPRSARLIDLSVSHPIPTLWVIKSTGLGSYILWLSHDYQCISLNIFILPCTCYDYITMFISIRPTLSIP